MLEIRGNNWMINGSRAEREDVVRHSQAQEQINLALADQVDALSIENEQLRSELEAISSRPTGPRNLLFILVGALLVLLIRPVWDFLDMLFSTEVRLTWGLVLVLIVLFIVGMWWLRENWPHKAAIANRLNLYGRRNKQGPTGSDQTQTKSSFLRKLGIGIDHQGGGS